MDDLSQEKGHKKKSNNILEYLVYKGISGNVLYISYI